jgi:hypothetical protein
MKSRKPALNNIFLLLAAAVCTVPAHAADTKAEALAKQSQNPVANLISVPFENNANFNAGPDDKVLNVLNIKPVIPVKLNDDWMLINRAIIPVISQPGVSGTPEDDRINGFGDVTYQGFFSPSKPTASGWIWGAGPTIQLPVHSNDRLGNNRWAAGPAAVVLKMPGHWVFGGLASQIWDITSSSKDPDISSLVLQPFVNYNFGGGWYVSSAPVITADWEANSGNQWTVPLGGGIGRVIHWGKQAVNLKAAVYGNVVRPDNASDYNIQLSATFLFPEKK